MSHVKKGRPVSADEQQQLTALQGLFKPADALKRVDDFAKWIFASITVVGTLGAGLSNVAFQTLSGAGKFVLAGAIFLVGLSLYAATRALEPQWVHANLASRDSMLAAVDVNLRRRRRPVQFAAALFAAALVTAALAPLTSMASAWFHRQHVVLNYEWVPDGKLRAQLTGVGLEAYAAVEVSLATSTTPPVEQLRIHKAADENGKADATLEVALSLPAGTPLKLTGQWTDASETHAPIVHEQTLNISVPVAKPTTTKAPTMPATGPSKESKKSTSKK